MLLLSWMSDNSRIYVCLNIKEGIRVIHTEILACVDGLFIANPNDWGLCIDESPDPTAC